MSINDRVRATLVGELGLRRCSSLLNHTQVRRCCEPLLALLQPRADADAWAPTPWGHTLPRSCVGASKAAYLASLAARPSAACAALEQVFAAPLVAWLEQQFGLPLQPLALAQGASLPCWALRVMAEGKGLEPHCEQVWNPLNLVENGSLLPVAFEPAFQLSYLYVLEAPAQGGELELFDRQGLATRGRTMRLRSTAVVPPRPGELLLFNAGVHWHRIRPSHTPGRRVVLGGFVRLNSSHTALHAYV